MASIEFSRALTACECIRISVVGHVQGVGFRPFIYRLARDHDVRGQVRNMLGEVDIVAQARPDKLRDFMSDIVSRAPPLARPSIRNVEPVDDAEDFLSFSIAESSTGDNARIYVPPDNFMCDDCRRELGDLSDRRYRYPFINCTHCGPRYTLIEALPYDRVNTSMDEFPLCAACETEYRSPDNRRFHAEPVACPDCGPELRFESGRARSTPSPAPLTAALDELRAGRIVAVKGIGGYHLLCDARRYVAIERLRERKTRPDKPLAVMFPLRGSDALAAVRQYVELTGDEADLVSSPARPIVLCAKRANGDLADNVAPGLSEIGVFLPYSPLHQLLLDEFDGPLVATSGNVSGEPVLIDEQDCSRQLTPIADAFLHHNRRIVRPADDPVFRSIDGVPRPIRIGRGTAPLELELPWQQERPTLAVGGHMKATLALSWDNRIVVSPHIGDMDSPRSLRVFEQLVADLQSLYGISAERIVCDAHPGYTTHRWARRQDNLSTTTVWHHEAHASALAAEFDRPGQWLVYTWDGVGLGSDGTLWGGEALMGRAGNWQRVGSLRNFRLPGGERAGREPWRSAAALFWECGQHWSDTPDCDGLARAAWHQRLNCPETSAAGRLFDAAASLICGISHASFEAQGPMLLEALCRNDAEHVPLPIEPDAAGVDRIDWQALLPVISDAGIDPAERAEIFHSSMAHAILDQTRRLRQSHGVEQVGLCGGVFQNRVLAELTATLLREDSMDVFIPEKLPVNDAGLCAGQAAHIAASMPDR